MEFATLTMSIFDPFYSAFGWIMRVLYDLVNNYGLVIILFTILIRGIFLLPLNIRSQRSMMKQQAVALCDELGDHARRAGAVNTLVRRGNGWLGLCTDGRGLVRDLTERNGLDLRGRRVLLIGAGGAARGVAPALLDAGIGDLYVVNRTPEHADALADAMGQPGRVHPRYFDDLGKLGEFTLVIQATSAARGAGLP